MNSLCSSLTIWLTSRWLKHVSKRKGLVSTALISRPGRKVKPPSHRLFFHNFSCQKSPHLFLLCPVEIPEIGIGLKSIFSRFIDDVLDVFSQLLAFD